MLQPYQSFPRNNRREKEATGTETCKLDFKQSAVYSKRFEPGGNM